MLEINKKLLGRRIKDIRVNICSATMEEFGKLVDSGKSNVSRWERGENVPNDLTLKKIAELGNIPVDELLYGNPRDFAYNTIIQELNSYGKLWYELSSMVKNEKEITDPTELYEAVLKLINDNFDDIYRKTKKSLTILNYQYSEKATIYDKKEFIISNTINHFISPINKEYTFSEFYNKIKGSINPIGYSETRGTIEEIKNRYMAKGYNETEATDKAIDEYFITKTSRLIEETEIKLNDIYEEYLDMVGKL